MSAKLSLVLNEHDAPAEPFALFGEWYQAALDAQLPEPSAMTLATAMPNGLPSARMVLLRGFDERGLAFYTNYNSRKAAELTANPQAALVLFWAPLQRQIRVEGAVERVAPAESDAYFRSRPYGHRISALASPQSQVISERAPLEARVAQLTAQFPSEVPRPDHWGGFRVVPAVFEFWQGRDSRLHDRLRYQRKPDGTWTRERLAP